MFKFKRGISSPIGILIIVVAILAGGILVWRYFGVPKKMKPLIGRFIEMRSMDLK